MSATLHLSYQVVVPYRALLGEGPVWDATTKTICWVDILNGHIHEFTPASNRHRILPVNDLVGAVALCGNGDFLAALKNGLAFVDRKSGAVSLLDHPEAHRPQNRFNDGKCDPAGRFWIGSMSVSEEPRAGSLYTIEKDLSHAVKMEGVTISNGMAWSPGGRVFYYIDTPTFEVVAYDFDLETGTIENKRVVVRIPEEDGAPDGMTIDTEGMLWIAHWDGWQVTRWDPRSGNKLLGIRLPVARVTSCIFGGDDLGDLYITSASVGLSEQQLEEQPLAGSLFVIPHCGFRGMEALAFDYQKSGI